MTEDRDTGVRPDLPPLEAIAAHYNEACGHVCGIPRAHHQTEEHPWVAAPAAEPVPLTLDALITLMNRSFLNDEPVHMIAERILAALARQEPSAQEDRG